MASMYSTRIGVLTSLTRRSFNSVLQKRVRKFAEMSSPLDKIPDVDIDGNGVFKYILVEIHDDVNKQSKPIVRGYARCTWHGVLHWALDHRLYRTNLLFTRPRGLFTVEDSQNTPVFFQADIYEEIGNEVKPHGSGIDTECVGGGRINHDAAGKNIKVYGYSQGFGQANHEISVNLLKKKYPDYVITWSNEGY